MGVSEKVKEAGLILSALGVIGFIGVVWLMIYGNLSGNLGFGLETTSIINETQNLTGTFTVDQADGKVNPSLSSVIIVNASSGTLVPATNYSTSAGDITSLGGPFKNLLVNITYTLSFDETGKVNTEGVINNISGGFSTFFGFSNTFFTIAAIVLLIFMLVGLLAIVMLIAEGKKSKKESFV